MKFDPKTAPLPTLDFSALSEQDLDKVIEDVSYATERDYLCNLTQNRAFNLAISNAIGSNEYTELWGVAGWLVDIAEEVGCAIPVEPKADLRMFSKKIFQAIEEDPCEAFYVYRNRWINEVKKHLKMELSIRASAKVTYYEIVMSAYHDTPVGRLRYQHGGTVYESALYTPKELNNILALWKSGELKGSFGVHPLADGARFQIVD